MTSDQLLTANGAPAVTHSTDVAQVTAAKPAVAGEILSAFASGLGPTRPGVKLDTAFPQSPLAVVNSPVNVTVGGKAADVLSAVGFPGAVNGYQVNFRMPEGVASGNAQIVTSSAWIAGVPATIAVKQALVCWANVQAILCDE